MSILDRKQDDSARVTSKSGTPIPDVAHNPANKDSASGVTGGAYDTVPPVRLLGSAFTSWEDKQEMSLAEIMDIPNFPDLSAKDAGRTSEPITRGVNSAQDQELLDLVTREKLRNLLDAPMGMVRFTEWIDEEGQPGSAALLRYYKDVRAQTVLMQEIKAISQGLDSTYFDQPNINAAFQGFAASPSQCLPALSSAVLAMSTAEDEALSRLYSREFKRFISGKINEQASACLGALSDLADRGDLGEIFCLADPRQRDCPLVYVSDGFCELSEYPRKRLVGRNCRFLQGPGTDPEAVRLLKEAVQAGKEHSSLLLNYSRTGKPFWNLLTMIPLRNAAGEVDYFLGAQINVNRALTSRETFEALMSMSQKGRGRSDLETTKIEFSQDVLSAAGKEAKTPTVLRQIAALQSPIPGNSLLPSVSPEPRNEPASSGKMQRWYSDLKSRRSSQSVKKAAPLDHGKSGTTPMSPTVEEDTQGFKQEVDVPVRDHMENVASVYSKIIIFRANDRKISHVTPALLDFLGYPTATPKDRYSSILVDMDVLTLLADTAPAITRVNRQMIGKSINDRSPHSLFTGLKMYDSRRSKEDKVSVGEDVEVTASGAPFTRGLIHLTPVKDINDNAVSYVLVVG